MKKDLNFFLVYVVLFVFFSKLGGAIIYPEFISSLQRKSLCNNWVDGEREYNSFFFQNIDQAKLSFFKQLYSKNIDKISRDHHKSLKIPKIIHQIWLGGPLPQNLEYWMNSWMSLQGWEYKLWTDKDVENLEMVNRDLYDKSKNFAQKSDILRLEILAHIGGIYVDTDFQCLNSNILEELNRSCDFFICIAPLTNLKKKNLNLRSRIIFRFNNAIMASSPNHPLMSLLLDKLHNQFDKYEKTFNTPILLTGPDYITQVIFKYEQEKTDEKINLYLPSTFFYPVDYYEAKFFSMHPEKPIFIAPETAGIHYWNSSWTKLNKINFYRQNEICTVP